MQIARPDQTRVDGDVRSAAAAGHRLVLVQAPTGFGKTTVLSMQTERAHAKRRRTWVVVHRQELERQAATRLRGRGIPVAEFEGPADHGALTHVLSIQTIASRLSAGAIDTLPPRPDLGHVDEAHHTAAATWHSAIEWMAQGGAVVVGWTATPWQPDGTGLPLYTHLVRGPNPAELVGPGLPLCPVRIWTGAAPSTAGLSSSGVDFSSVALAERFKGLEADIVDTWRLRAGGLKTLVFAVNVAHSLALVESFKAKGIRAAHVDGNTPDAERQRTFSMLETGELTVVSNVALVIEGFDCPSVECVLLARATRSEMVFVQACGRGLRASEGKQHLVLLDHGRNVARFGHPLSPRHVELGGSRPRPKSEREVEAETRVTDDGMRLCRHCLAMVHSAPLCEECGLPLGSLPKVNRQATLKEWMQKEATQAATPHQILLTKRRHWARLLTSCRNKGQSWKVAAAIYAKAYGKSPTADGILSSEEIRRLARF